MVKRVVYGRSIGYEEVAEDEYESGCHCVRLIALSPHGSLSQTSTRSSSSSVTVSNSRSPTRRGARGTGSLENLLQAAMSSGEFLVSPQTSLYSIYRDFGVTTVGHIIRLMAWYNLLSPAPKIFRVTPALANLSQWRFRCARVATCRIFQLTDNTE